MNRCPNGCGVDLDVVRAIGGLGHLCSRAPLAGMPVVLPPERDAGFRVADVVDQGEMLGNVRETLRRNLHLWTESGGSPATREALAEMLARHVTQMVMVADVRPPAGYVIVRRSDVSACGEYRYDFAPELGGGDAAHIERIGRYVPSLPPRIAAVAADLETRQDVALANRCSGCGRPEHPSNTDDENRCASCVRAAGETPLTPNQD